MRLSALARIRICFKIVVNNRRPPLIGLPDTADGIYAELEEYHRRYPFPDLPGDPEEERQFNDLLSDLGQIMREGDPRAIAVVDMALEHQDEPDLGLVRTLGHLVTELIASDPEGNRDRVKRFLLWEDSASGGQTPVHAVEALEAAVNEGRVDIGYVVSLGVRSIAGIMNDDGGHDWMLGMEPGTREAAGRLTMWEWRRSQS